MVRCMLASTAYQSGIRMLNTRFSHLTDLYLQTGKGKDTAVLLMELRRGAHLSFPDH